MPQARLTPKAIEAGCVSATRRRHFETALAERDAIERLLVASFTGSQLDESGIAVRDDGIRRSLGEWLRFPELEQAACSQLVPELSGVSASRLEEAVQDHRYAPLCRAAAERDRAAEERRSGADSGRLLDLAAYPACRTRWSNGCRAARPSTLGAAARIRGITPAALAAILVHARRKAA